MNMSYFRWWSILFWRENS